MSHPKASQLLGAMFSGMGGGMGDAFASAMDGDDEPMPTPEPKQAPAPAPKPAAADPHQGLSEAQKTAIKEKELGNEAYKKKDFEAALSHYEKAIESDPTNITYLTNKAGKKSLIKAKFQIKFIIILCFTDYSRLL